LDLEQQEGGEKDAQRIQHVCVSVLLEKLAESADVPSRKTAGSTIPMAHRQTAATDQLCERHRDLAPRQLPSAREGQSVGLENSAPSATSPHGAPWASQLKPMWPVSACWSRKSRSIG